MNTPRDCDRRKTADSQVPSAAGHLSRHREFFGRRRSHDASEIQNCTGTHREQRLKGAEIHWHGLHDWYSEARPGWTHHFKGL